MSSRREKLRKPVRLLALAGVALAVAAVALVAPGSPARAFSILGPAMTVANGNSVIAVQTANDGLRFYWNQHGTDNWYGEQVAGAGTPYSPSAITVVGNDVVIAAEGPLSSMYVYWQAFGASGWTSKPVAGIGTTYSQPAIQADGTSSVIAAEGANNSLDFYWAVNGTADWIPQEVPVGALNAPAVVAYPYVQGSPGGVHLVSNAFADYMVVTTEADGSFDWQDDTSMCPPAGLAGSGCSTGNPSAVMNGGLLNIATEDGQGNLCFWWQDSGGTWHEETVDTSGDL